MGPLAGTVDRFRAVPRTLQLLVVIVEPRRRCACDVQGIGEDALDARVRLRGEGRGFRGGTREGLFGTQERLLHVVGLRG